MIMRRLLLVCIVAIMVVAPSVSKAEEAGDYDVKKIHRVLSRALSFVRGRWEKNPSVNVALIYPSGNSSALSAANEIEQLIQGQKTSNSGTYNVSVIGAADFSNSQSAGFDVVYFLKGASSVCTQNRLEHALTITSDMDCIKSKSCVLGIDVGRDVTLYLDEALMRRVGIDFDAAFKFMVKKV